MTVKDFVLSKPVMSINQWLDLTKNLPVEKQDLIIKAADFYNKIEINHKSDFIKAINI